MPLRIFLSTLFLFFTLCFPVGAFQGVVQSFGDSGTLFWGDGSLTANATVVLPTDELDAERMAPLAVRQAVRKARRTLLEMIMAVHIDARLTVADYMDQSPDMAARIRGLVQSSPIEHPALAAPQGEVRVFEKLRGALAQLLLPPTLPFQSKIPPHLAMALTGLDAVKSEPVVGREAVRQYTGLVVDARGLPCNPALAPVLYGQDGTGAYGTYVASREAVVDKGLVAYSISPMTNVVRERVGDRPLVVRALGVLGPYRTDLVVSIANARFIRAMFESGEVVRDLRVVIVLDEPASEPVTGGGDEQ